MVLWYNFPFLAKLLRIFIFAFAESTGFSIMYIQQTLLPRLSVIQGDALGYKHVAPPELLNLLKSTTSA